MLGQLRNRSTPTTVGAIGVLCLWVTSLHADEAEWHVGLARAGITPSAPIAMSGYGPRESDGVLDELCAKALAIQDRHGQRALLVTADLLFFRAPFAESLCARITEKTGLKRDAILLNASHTHAGPVFGTKDPDRFDLNEPQRRVVEHYTGQVRDTLVALASEAIADLKPARISWGRGQVAFVMNRRLIDEHGKCRGMGPNPAGTVDRDVPVLRIDHLDGKLRSLVFGCACHAVTLDGHNRKISGDYAGAAQRFIERQLGGQAMFVIGCGADANTHPRGGANQEELVGRHGEAIGLEVCRVADRQLQPVRGPLRVLLEWTDLPLNHAYPREELTAIANGGSHWHARNASGMLEVLDRGQPLPTHYRSPIALWQFGNDLTLVGLPGEAVADYAAKLRDALGPDGLWVAAYCNESFGYLPTAKILAEGGHETIGLTLDIGLFSPAVEPVVLDTVRRLSRQVGRTAAAQDADEK